MHCKGRMFRGTAPFSLDRNGHHVSWDAISAWVYSQCGEPSFESREVELIQKALTELDRESATLTSAGSSAAWVSSLSGNISFADLHMFVQRTYLEKCRKRSRGNSRARAPDSKCYLSSNRFMRSTTSAGCAMTSRASPSSSSPWTGAISNLRSLAAA